jgi:hypothetical protein
MSIASALTEQGTLQVPLNSLPERSSTQVRVLASARPAQGVAIRAGTNAIPIAKALTSMSPLYCVPLHDATSENYGKHIREPPTPEGRARKKLLFQAAVRVRSGPRAEVERSSSMIACGQSVLPLAR